MHRRCEENIAINQQSFVFGGVSLTRQNRKGYEERELIRIRAGCQAKLQTRKCCKTNCLRSARRHDKSPSDKSPSDKSPRRQNPQTTKPPNDKSIGRQKPQPTKAPEDKSPRHSYFSLNHKNIAGEILTWFWKTNQYPTRTTGLSVRIESRAKRATEEQHQSWKNSKLIQK